jgi:hypothetical protein
MNIKADNVCNMAKDKFKKYVYPMRINVSILVNSRIVIPVYQVLGSVTGLDDYTCLSQGMENVGMFSCYHYIISIISRELMCLSQSAKFTNCFVLL